MSLAASLHELESPTHEKAYEINSEETVADPSIEKLLSISAPSAAGPVIAIDLDDVLSQTNRAVAEYYYYWKNPFWGTLSETHEKVNIFYKTNRVHQTIPVPGAREGVQVLRNMGFKLIIVTARGQDVATESWKWVEHFFPGLFDSLICTGQYKDAVTQAHKISTKLTKAEVCADLEAKLLIDDSIENALECATGTPPTPVLLFGEYEWNIRLSSMADYVDEMSFDLRLAAAGGKEFWKAEVAEIPPNAPLKRVRDWGEVVKWIENARRAGSL